MENQPKPIQFEDFVSHAKEFFDQVISGRSVTIERGGRLIRLTPLHRKKAENTSFSAHDALWDIVGLGASNGATDVSSDKHKYLAEPL